jgi:hypothetical protein
LTPELNQTVNVQPDGFITLLGVGDLHVEGQIVPDVRESIRAAYAKTLHSPILTVRLIEFEKPYFIVGGEVGHALIDENLPVVVLATRDDKDADALTRYEKSVSNIKEVKARDGIVISIVTEGDQLAREASDHILAVPPTFELLSPLLEIVPLQLLAYHIAVRRGCDVDQPRNLAKSVTVE